MFIVEIALYPGKFNLNIFAGHFSGNWGNRGTIIFILKCNMEGRLTGQLDLRRYLYIISTKLLTYLTCSDREY